MSQGGRPPRARNPVFFKDTKHSPGAIMFPAEVVPLTKLILLVDDDRDTLEAYAVLFQALGHTTATASDGPQALTAARELHPDLILLDVGLPRMGGVDVLRELRTRED